MISSEKPSESTSNISTDLRIPPGQCMENAKIFIEPVSVKSLKFIAVGAINTIVFYVVFVLLIRLGLHYSLALLIDYTGGIAAGYYMNRYWTFVSHRRPMRSALKYCVAYGIVYCLNLVLLGLIVELRVMGPIPGQIVITVIIAVISFFLQNFWVFHSIKEPDRGTGPD